jgi:hypothetical protein
MLVGKLVKEPDGQLRHMPTVREVKPVSLPQRLGAGEHLAAELLCAPAIAPVGDVEQHAGTQGSVTDHQPACGGFSHQRAVDEQGRRERLGVRGRHPKAFDQLVLLDLCDLVAERQKTIACDFARATFGIAVEDLRRREAHIATDSDDVRDAVQRHLDPDLFDDVGDIAAEKSQLHVVAVTLEIELLAHPD